MELYDVMRTTFAAREFTADPLPDEVLAKILDQARFAPSGGNRQGWRVIVVRDAATKRALADLSAFAGRRYAAQAANGESPWNTIDPPRVDAATIERTPVPPRLTESIATAPVVLVVCVDLKVVASIDQDLDVEHSSRVAARGVRRHHHHPGHRARAGDQSVARHPRAHRRLRGHAARPGCAHALPAQAQTRRRIQQAGAMGWAGVRALGAALRAARRPGVAAGG